MQRQQAPFCAGIVGSFLRLNSTKQARQQLAEGTIDVGQLHEIENNMIRHLVQQQCDCGLYVVIDGEFHRVWWHFDFSDGLQGVERYDAEQGIQFNSVQTKMHNVRVTGKLALGDHPVLEDFRYLRSTGGDAQSKMTALSPNVLHFCGGQKDIDANVYPDLSGYFGDLTTTWRDAARVFYDTGCRYLQLDDTVWTYLCSDTQCQQIRERDGGPDALARICAQVLSQVLGGKPADLTVGLHVCRGNFCSTWISEGGYESVTEVLLGGINVDAFSFRYDNDRSENFAPLRFTRPGHQQVVFGLITTKNGELENPQGVKARLAEATQYVPLEQICLSSQCGFASTEEGNALSEGQQWQKVRLVASITADVW